MKPTLSRRVRKILFRLSLWWNAIRIRSAWSPLSVKPLYWAYLLGVEDPEHATLAQVEARARYLTSQCGRTREEIQRALIEATYNAHIAPQVRAIEAAKEREHERLRLGLAAYKAALRDKGKHVGPDDEGAA